jgi:BirA family biotin operon repressor/biotin-[acetyl-CoA-carboxylase] ligase
MVTDWVQADPLHAFTIHGLLTTHLLGRSLIEVHSTITSTNDRMRHLARTGVALPGAVVLAEEQSQGRGRAGNAWVSLPGAGLWMTVLVTRGTAPPGLLTLGAGVAVRRAVEREAGVQAALKWPNDLEVGGAKLCGILGEVVGEKAIALGIGINVHLSPPPAEIGRAPIALDDVAGQPVVRNLLAAHLLAELEQVLADLESGDRQAQVLAAWREGCSHLGQRVQVTPGPHTEIGIALDIDPSGALLLRREDGTVVAVHAGSLAVMPS